MLICDPPSGWLYGFPKPAPSNYWGMADEDFHNWLVSEGYPQKEVDVWTNKARGVPCRFWENEDANG